MADQWTEMDKIKVETDMRGKHVGGETHRMFTWFNRENREETRESEEHVLHYRREERREGWKMRLKGSGQNILGQKTNVTLPLQWKAN